MTTTSTSPTPGLTSPPPSTSVTTTTAPINMDADAAVAVNEAAHRRRIRRRVLALRAEYGDSMPAAPDASKARRLFLHSGPDYEWRDGQTLVISFGSGERRLSVSYRTAALTETELRRLSRAAAIAPDLIYEELVTGRAAHVHQAVEVVAGTIEGPVLLARTVPVPSAGGRLGSKRAEREE